MLSLSDEHLKQNGLFGLGRALLGLDHIRRVVRADHAPLDVRLGWHSDYLTQILVIVAAPTVDVRAGS